MMDEKLRPFQRRFIKAVESSSYDTVALSGPRGLGKTFLAGHVLARALTPGDIAVHRIPSYPGKGHASRQLNQPGAEYVLGAASLDQARMTYAFVRAALEPTGEYRFIDSTTRLGITHKASNTKLRAISSNAKSAIRAGECSDGRHRRAWGAGNCRRADDGRCAVYRPGQGSQCVEAGADWDAIPDGDRSGALVVCFLSALDRLATSVRWSSTW